MIDLEYDPESLLPPFPPERVRELEQWWSAAIERRVRLPKALAKHFSQYHGGVPGRRYFRTAAGDVRELGRFFTLLEETDLTGPRVPSWRPSWGSPVDIRLDYRIRRYHEGEYWAQRLQEHDESLELLPIGGLLSPGSQGRTLDEEDDYDLLCLDYAAETYEQPVVIWRFLADWSEPPVIEPVSRSFEAFLSLLQRV